MEPDPAQQRSALRIRLLGGMQLLASGRTLKFAAPPKAASLLAYLLVHRAQPASRDGIAFTFWPDDDETRARANVRRHMALVVHALPVCAVQPILADNRVIQWNPLYPCTLDVAEFEQFSRDPERAADAAAVYGGDLLPDAYDEWVLPERERLRSMHGANLERLTETYATAGDYARAIATTRTLLQHDPWREDAIRTLIALRQAAGDRSGALQEYERFAERLQRDLDTAPMAETVSLYEAVLRRSNAPAIDRPASALERAVAPATMPFVGRGEELLRLRQMWMRAMRGQGGIAVISGEAGIGKSRLMAEFAATVGAQGGTIVAGAATFPEAVPYQAVIEALRSALPSVVNLPLDPAWLAAAADVLPDLRDIDPRLPHLSPLEPARQQDRLFEAVWRCFEGLAQVRPMLLQIEDVHWTGPATNDLLAYLARRTRGHPMLLIVTSRDDEPESLHALRRALRRSGGFTTIALGGLSPEDVALVVQSALGKTIEAAGFAQRVHELCCGNPFFLAEIVRDCLAADAMAEPVLPQSLASTIEARIAALSADAQSLAEIAAVVGRAFTVEIIAGASGASEAVTVACMDELLDVRLIRAASCTQERSGDEFTFTHDIIRSQLYARIADTPRRRVHRRVGMVLEALGGEERAALATELAHHFDQGLEPGKAAAAYLSAARQALRVYADGEALRALSRVLELSPEHETRIAALSLRESVYGRAGRRTEQLADIEALEAAAARTHDEDEALACMRRRVVYARAVDDVGAQQRWIAALRERIAPARQPAWHAFCDESSAGLLTSLGRYDDALAAARQAARAYAEVNDDGGVVRSLCLVADIRTLRVEPAAAQAALDDATAIAVASSNEASIVRALATASLAAYMAVDFERAKATADRGLEMCRTIGDRQGEADFLFRLGNIAGRRFAVAETAHMYAAATAIYEALNKPLGQAIVLLNTGLLYLKIGEHAEALRALHLARAVFLDADDLRGLTICALNLGMAAYLRGRYAAALRLSQKAVALARRLGNPQLECSALGNIGAAERELGNHEASLSHSETALEQRRRMAPMDIGSDLADMGLTYLRAGNLERARTIAAEIDALPAAALASVMFPQNVLWSAAQIYASAEHHEYYAGLLRRAVTIYQERRANIPDGPWRRAYELLSFNRDICAAQNRESDALRTPGVVR